MTIIRSQIEQLCASLRYKERTARAIMEEERIKAETYMDSAMAAETILDKLKEQEEKPA